MGVMKYVVERLQPITTIIMVVGLGWSAFLFTGVAFDPFNGIVGLIGLLWVRFLTRLADDKADYHLDLHMHPERALSQGFLLPQHIGRLYWVLVVVMIALWVFLHAKFPPQVAGFYLFMLLHVGFCQIMASRLEEYPVLRQAIHMAQLILACGFLTSLFQGDAALRIETLLLGITWWGSAFVFRISVLFGEEQVRPGGHTLAILLLGLLTSAYGAYRLDLWPVVVPSGLLLLMVSIFVVSQSRAGQSIVRTVAFLNLLAHIYGVPLRHLLLLSN